MVECFVAESNVELVEIVFVHRFVFDVRPGEGTVHGSSFTTSYAFRSISWGVRVSTDAADPEIELRSLLSRFEEPNPSGKCGLRYEAISKNFEDVSEGELEPVAFRGQVFSVRREQDFAMGLQAAAHAPSMVGGTLSVTISLRFAPAEFFAIQFPVERVPPSTIANDDFRFIGSSSEFASAKDFKIVGTDGELSTSKYLVYLSCLRFHELLEENPDAVTVAVPFEKELLEQVIGFATKGTLSLTSKSVDKIRQLLECVQYVRPLMRDQLLSYIRFLLTQMLIKDWKTSSLEYIVKMLDVAYEYRFISLFDVSLNLLADQHFVQFRRQYNERAEGERGLVYRRLSFSTMGPFFTPTQMVINLVRKSGTSLRFLSWAKAARRTRKFIE